jgi:hypothetical protein
MKLLGSCFVVITALLTTCAAYRSDRFAGNPLLPVCLLGLALCTGCLTTASSNRIWNSREGSYSVSQAVKELGRPTQTAILSDGSQVGTWMVRAGSRGSLTRGIVPIYTAHTIDYNLYSTAPFLPDVFIRLLFGPDGKLIAWDRQYK